MCSKPEPIILLRDTTILSERDGSKSIYWSDRSTWQAFAGARGGLVSFRVLSVLGSPEVKLFLQGSVDGRSWVDLPDSDNTFVVSSEQVEFGLLGVAISSSNASGAMRVALSHQTAGYPLLRVGVQIEDTSGNSTQVEARLNLAITPCSSGGDVPLAIGLAIDSDADVDTRIGPMFSGIDVDQVSFSTTLTKGNTDQLKMQVQSASDPNGTWQNVQEIDLSSTGTELTNLTSVDKSRFGTWVRVVVSQALSGSATLSLVATVRMR